MEIDTRACAHSISSFYEGEFEEDLQPDSPLLNGSELDPNSALQSSEYGEIIGRDRSAHNFSLILDLNLARLVQEQLSIAIPYGSDDELP